MPTGREKDEAGLSALADRKLRALKIPEPSIAEGNVGICWDQNWREEGRGDPGGVASLQIVDLADIRGGRDPQAALVWRQAGSTDGACCSDWLLNPRRTCLGKFSEWTFDGWVPSGQAYGRFLAEFAKVHECGWARMMLVALYSSDQGDGERTDLLRPE